MAEGIIRIIQEVAVLKQLRLDVRRLDQIVERVLVRKDQAGQRESLENAVAIEAVFR